MKISALNIVTVKPGLVRAQGADISYSHLEGSQQPKFHSKEGKMTGSDKYSH